MSPKLFWLGILALPLPLVGMYFFNLWFIDQYQFFVVLLLVIGILFYSRWNRNFEFPKRRWIQVITALGFAGSILASTIFSPWLAFLSFLLSITGFAICHKEKESTEGHEPLSAGNLFYLTLPLWLCLRIPLNYDQQLTFGLQHLTAGVSSFCLDLLAIPHQVSGVIFDLASGKLFVEEACSGVQSLFALLCVSLLLLALNRRPVVLAPIYALAAIFSAALFNVVRVVSIAAAQEWYSLDLAHGWRHDLLGYSCLGGAILLLASFDRLFRVVFFPIPKDAEVVQLQRIPNPLKLTWNKLLSPVKSLTAKSKTAIQLSFPRWQWNLLLICVIGSWSCQFVFGAQNLLRERKAWVDGPVGGKDIIWQPPETLFASEQDLVVEGFQQFRNGEDLSRGQNTDIWMVLDTKTGLRHRVAISQPYYGFHDLCICYAGNGWRMGDRAISRQIDPSFDSQNWDYVYSTWFNDNGTYAYLAFSGLNRDNTPASVPDETLTDIFSNRFSIGGNLNDQTKEFIMIQVWNTLDSPLSVEDQNALRDFHLRLRAIVSKQFTNRTVPKL
jgi:exosortase